MTPDQILKKPKNPLFWLLILVIVFIIKGTIVNIFMPFFQGPDEAIHFAQMERWAEPQIPNWPITLDAEYLDNLTSTDIRTHHFPEEIIQTGYLTQFDEVKSQKENRQLFTDTVTGLNEQKILTGNWKQFLDIYPPTTSDTWSIYYLFGSKIEKLFNEYSIFFRFFTIRLLSVILGAGVVALSYFTSRKIKFSSWISILFASILTFQPMFVQTASIINYDIAIIFSFSLFLYAGVSLLRQGFSWFPFSLFILSIILGIASKGPGIVLVIISIPLLMTLTYRHFHPNKRRFYWGVLLTGSLGIALAFLFVPATYLASITNLTATSKFDSPLQSIGSYLEKTIDTGPLRNTAGSYWGNFGWLDTPIPGWMLSLIIYICVIGLVGALWYIFSKRERPTFLPERQYILFFLVTMIALQLAIRFYDWRIFDATGQIVIGQPGRYFLPNLIAFLAVVVTGLGFLMRKERRFILVMQVLALSMILMQLHTIVNVILPRYYL